MGLFTKSIGSESYIQKLHSAVSIAFNHIKSDIENISYWVNHLHEKHNLHDKRISEHNSLFSNHSQHIHDLHSRISFLENQFSYIPKSPEEIRKIIDSHYSMGAIHQKIDELKTKIESLESSSHKSPSRERKVHVRENIVQRIAKNSKDYVKSMILSLISKYGSISGPQLKEMIVQEQGLCSKSSFYRLLLELEESSQLSVIQRGKEKVYMPSAEILN